MTGEDVDVVQVVRRVARVQIAVGVLALVGIVAAVLAGQMARHDAARDACHFTLGLVRSATPPGRVAAANAYVHRTPLHNCNVYADRLVWTFP